MQRIYWIEGAKGLAIALVVFGHVLGGVLGRGWLDTAGAWRNVYDYVYLFHMPLFFMVSGFFCIEAMRRSPTNAFLSLVGSVAWPYLLWDVLVRAALLPIIGTFMLSPPKMTWAEWLTKAALGDLSWFLWTLFVMQAILIPIARVPVWILFALSLVLFRFGDRELLGNFASVAYFLPFLLFGALLHPVLDRLNIAGSRLQLGAALAVFPLMAIALAMGWTDDKFVKLACGIAGSIAIMMLVQCVKASVARGLLVGLGMASLAIYVLHPYFQGAARAVIYWAIGPNPFLQVALVTAVAIAGPFLVWLAAERFKAPWLFRLRLAGPPRATRMVASVRE